MKKGVVVNFRKVVVGLSARCICGNHLGWFPPKDGWISSGEAAYLPRDIEHHYFYHPDGWYGYTGDFNEIVVTHYPCQKDAISIDDIAKALEGIKK